MNLKYFKQEKSKTCGLAVLRMVLEYYNIHLTEKEIENQVPMHNFGTYTTDLAQVALKNGLKVITYTNHLPLFGPLKLKRGTLIDESIYKDFTPIASTKTSFKSIKDYIKCG